MVLELNIFLVILVASAVLYLAGVLFKLPHLFLLGCVLIFGSGAILWGAGGLITSYYYDVNGLLATNVLLMSDIGLQMFAFILVVLPILSVFIIDLNPVRHNPGSPFHF